MFNIYGTVDIADAFHRFIDEETWKYETEIGDSIINEFLNETDGASDPPYVEQFPEPVIIALKFYICFLFSPNLITILLVVKKVFVFRSE